MRSKSVAPVIHRRQVTIAWGDCDPAGIVFNPRFFEFFDASTWQLFDLALGVKPHELNATYGIIGIPLVDAGANFIKAVKFGDITEIETRAVKFGRASFQIEHRLLVGGVLHTEGNETRVWAAQDPADPGKIKGVAIPAEVIAKFG
jgi:4-hydroxybenzoyl-CoA thioesterase